MNTTYPAEEEKKIEKLIFPSYSKPIIMNIKLIINERASKHAISKIIYQNNIYYEKTDLELCFPNGEKFKGLLSPDFCLLQRGNYTWPNGQQYYGQFDENNNFNTLEGELSKLTFSNGDIFEGSFENGEIREGTYKSHDGREYTGDFTGGKINGRISIIDKKKKYKFDGFIQRGKKEGICYTEIQINNKVYSIKGEYIDGLKEGTFIIQEISPNAGNLYIKGKYRMGFRHGYFDITDKDEGIEIKHKYISFFHAFQIKEYNKKYKTEITGKENNISLTCRDNPIKQLNELVQIRFSNLLTFDISRSKINSISFLNTNEKTLFSLQNLILSYNHIKDLEPLVTVYYPRLKKLMANDNQIKNITCIQNFQFEELEELNLSSNPIESLEGIDKWNFPNLFNLSFYRTNITDIQPMVNAEFPSLTQLDIYFTKIKPNKNNKITTKTFKKCESLKNVIFDSHY